MFFSVFVFVFLLLSFFLVLIITSMAMYKATRVQRSTRLEVFMILILGAIMIISLRRCL